ncbi:hypothetical protein ACFPMF_22145 [Larkinella bovis]|uniref:Uncharacterized protein n=1 Tax=Larkinella bovis TaxID=683041 RepID=A0ABW0ILM5_9BACT
MSFSSNSRKESTESYAAQRMGNTQGVAPEQSQLAKTDQPGDLLPSEAHDSNDVEVSDILPVNEQQTPNRNDANDPATNLVEITDESLARDEDGGLTGSKWSDERVPGADWNRDTEEREREELGHS